MISRIARLRAKKGFTIVELVVVISIITILLAMVIPMVNYDTKPAVAKSMAKEFYYKVQEVLTDCKAINAKLSDYNWICYYADLNEQGEVIQTGGYSLDGYDKTGETIYTDSTKDTAGRKMREMMINYLTSDLTRDMSGRLMAVCDKKYRVMGTYWVENEDLFVGGTEFVDECVLTTGIYCCAFPLSLSDTGSKTFDFTEIGIGV